VHFVDARRKIPDARRPRLTLDATGHRLGRVHPRRLAVLSIIVTLMAMVAGCDSGSSGPTAGMSNGGAPAQLATPVPTVRPVPGHEVYGFLPYWEMDGTIAAHVNSTFLTTIGLFSVTNARDGSIDTSQNGYRQIIGDIGAQLIREARRRGVRTQLVYTSFGTDRNTRLFEDLALQGATIQSLVGLATRLEVDGINVDVESLPPTLVPAYGAFVGRLRDAVLAANADGEVSVATSANTLGAAMAVAAADAGADRIFLMGYDYHSAGSSPGASAPLVRRDGSATNLSWSLDLYADLGVPVERTLLGLPLYGMAWPVAGPVIGAPRTGRGSPWIPRQHLDVLADPAIVPLRDETEVVEVYLIASDGSIGAPTEPASGGPGGPETRSWRAVYIDSPATLATKLALANDRGLAGAGLWAVGYERGLPGFTDLIGRFGAGAPLP
jgi:hypothetical protein